MVYVTHSIMVLKFAIAYFALIGVLVYSSTGVAATASGQYDRNWGELWIKFLCADTIDRMYIIIVFRANI